MSQTFIEKLNHAGAIALSLPVITVSVVAAPVIGLLAQPILAVQALYQVISQKFHFNKTKDENGLALSEDIDPETGVPRYMDWSMNLNAKDLTRFEHELARLKTKENFLNTLLAMKEFAKLMIPVFGLMWHFEAENEKLSVKQKVDPTLFYSEIRAIEHHLIRLRKISQA